MAKKTIKTANNQSVANCDQATNFEVANCDLKTMRIESLIRFIREKQVILDTDLAMLYGVETKRLKEQVKRNIDRFPDDFMFQLTKDEALSSRSQYCDLEEWPNHEKDNRDGGHDAPCNLLESQHKVNSSSNSR